MNWRKHLRSSVATGLAAIMLLAFVAYRLYSYKPFSQEKYDSGYTTAFNLNATVPPAWVDFADSSAQAGFDDARAVFEEIYPLDNLVPFTHTPLQRLRETLPLIKQSNLVRDDLKPEIVAELESILNGLEQKEPSEADAE